MPSSTKLNYTLMWLAFKELRSLISFRVTENSQTELYPGPKTINNSETLVDCGIFLNAGPNITPLFYVHEVVEEGKLTVWNVVMHETPWYSAKKDVVTEKDPDMQFDAIVRSCCMAVYERLNQDKSLVIVPTPANTDHSKPPIRLVD